MTPHAVVTPQAIRARRRVSGRSLSWPTRPVGRRAGGWPAVAKPADAAAWSSARCDHWPVARPPAGDPQPARVEGGAVTDRQRDVETKQLSTAGRVPLGDLRPVGALRTLDDAAPVLLEEVCCARPANYTPGMPTQVAVDLRANVELLRACWAAVLASWGAYSGAPRMAGETIDFARRLRWRAVARSGLCCNAPSREVLDPGASPKTASHTFWGGLPQAWKKRSTKTRDMVRGRFFLQIWTLWEGGQKGSSKLGASGGSAL